MANKSSDKLSERMRILERAEISFWLNVARFLSMAAIAGIVYAVVE